MMRTVRQRGSTDGRSSRSPALQLWRCEVNADLRGVGDVDPLWHAACLEIAAEEAEDDGLPKVAVARRLLAAAVIVVDARERKELGV